MILCKLGGTRYLYLIELGFILFYIHIYICNATFCETKNTTSVRHI